MINIRISHRTGYLVFRRRLSPGRGQHQRSIESALSSAKCQTTSLMRLDAPRSGPRVICMMCAVIAASGRVDGRTGGRASGQAGGRKAVDWVNDPRAVPCELFGGFNMEIRSSSDWKSDDALDPLPPHTHELASRATHTHAHGYKQINCFPSCSRGCDSAGLPRVSNRLNSATTAKIYVELFAKL